VGGRGERQLPAYCVRTAHTQSRASQDTLCTVVVYQKGARCRRCEMRAPRLVEILTQQQQAAAAAAAVELLLSWGALYDKKMKFVTQHSTHKLLRSSAAV